MPCISEGRKWFILINIWLWRIMDSSTWEVWKKRYFNYFFYIYKTNCAAGKHMWRLGDQRMSSYLNICMAINSRLFDSFPLNLSRLPHVHRGNLSDQHAGGLGSVLPQLPRLVTSTNELHCMRLLWASHCKADVIVEWHFFPPVSPPWRPHLRLPPRGHLCLPSYNMWLKTLRSPSCPGIDQYNWLCIPSV